MHKRTVIAGLALLLNAGCGSGINGGPSSKIDLNILNAGDSAALRSEQLEAWQPMNLSDLLLEPEAWDVSDFLMDALKNVGDGTPEILKYAIQKIDLCESLTVSGTAHGDGKCSTIYDAGASTPYIDVVNMKEARHFLNQNSRALPAGTYRYGTITWLTPVKVKGSVVLSGGGTVLKTRSTGSQYLASKHYTKMSDMADPGVEAEEATVILNNGGSWFKFQNEWAFDGKEEVALDLVFNPDNLLKGANETTNFEMRVDDNGAGIHLPMISLTPIVHKKSETISKEVYEIKEQDDLHADIRMEVYYITTDPQKTIYGVELRTVYNESTSASVMDPGKIFTVSNSGGVTTLYDWQNKELVSFKRLSSVNAIGEATVHCQNDNTDVCKITNQAVKAEMTLKSITEINQ